MEFSISMMNVVFKLPNLRHADLQGIGIAWPRISKRE